MQVDIAVSYRNGLAKSFKPNYGYHYIILTGLYII